MPITATITSRIMYLVYPVPCFPFSLYCVPVSTYQHALKHFKKADPKLYAAATALTGLPRSLGGKRRTDDLFAALVNSVISQQLSVRAADTIQGRVKEVCGSNITADAVAKATPARLRRAGLSAAKVKTIKSLAAAVRTKKLDLLSLKRIPEEEAVAKLTSVWGIGPWTAEMFLMFALGRTDVFSPGDLGLMRAMEDLYGLAKNGSRETLSEIAKSWSPYRTYASLILWKLRDPK
jgi:DNA-3-methyladenine glycosylase II